MGVMVVAVMNRLKGEHKMSDTKTEIRSIQARLKRIAINPEKFIKNEFDEKHVNGSFVEFPTLGKPFTFGFDKMDKGWLTTTPVKYLSWQDGKIVFGTQNSVYEVVAGWKD